MLLSMVLYMTGWGLHSMILRLQPSRTVNAFQPRALSMIEVGLIADGSNVNLYETERSMGREAHNKRHCSVHQLLIAQALVFPGKLMFPGGPWPECSHMQFKHCGSKPSGLPYFKSALASLFYAASKFSGNYNPIWSNITCTLYYFVITDVHLDLFRFFPQTQTTLNIRKPLRQSRSEAYEDVGHLERWEAHLLSPCSCRSVPDTLTGHLHWENSFICLL